jgi:hypothetical protein
MKTIKNTHPLTAPLLLAICAVFLAGCGTPRMHVTRTAPGSTPQTGKVQKVFDAGDRVTRPYEILGVVSAIGNRANVRTKARKMMVAEAERLGAEALVGYYFDDETTVDTGDADGWAGALAVRFLPDGSPRPAPCKAVVALPHTVVGEDFGTGRKAEKADAITRKHARMLLARNGYYAWFTEARLTSGFPADLNRLDAATRSNYGSPDADLVLAVSLGKRHAVNALLVVGATQQLGAVLYSKSADAVTWQSAGKGSGYDAAEMVTAAALGPVGVLSFGLAHAFVPSAKTIRAVHDGLGKAFVSLPDLSAPMKSK